MMGFLLLTFIFKYEAILALFNHVTQSNDSSAQSSNFWIWLILTVGVTGAVLFFLLRSALEKIAIFGKISKIVDGLLQGLTSIVRLKQPVRFFIYSFAIWICYFLAAYLVCFSLPETSAFGVADGFFIIVVGTLGMMIPASGGIGAFHFALKVGIGALFLSEGKSFEEGAAVGLAYAFI